MPSFAFKNGEPYTADLFSERAFVYADGAFETMKLLGGRVPLWSLHRDRAITTARRLAIPLSPDRLDFELDKYLKQLPEPYRQQSVVKLIVGRSGSGRGTYVPSLNKASKDDGADLFFSVRAHQTHSRSRVHLLSAGQCLYANPPLAGMKLLNRLPYIIASAGQSFKTDQEALFMDAEGSVVETMHHNIFWLEGTKLLTPSLKTCGVAGVMRRFIIEKAPALSLTLEQGDYPMQRLLDADSVFLTNAVEGLVSVDSIDGQPVATSALFNNILESVSPGVIL